MEDVGRSSSGGAAGRRDPATRLHAALATRVEYRFGLLLGLILVTFVVLMVGSTSAWVRPVTVGLIGSTLVVGLFAAGAALRVRRVAAVVSGVALVTSLTTVRSGRMGGGVTALMCAGLVAVVPVAIARSVVRRRSIDIHTVLAALAIYALLGMLWAFMFGILGGFGPEPFFAQSGVTASTADYLYFSFITQTTVGYGDLSPAGNVGRACAVLEAFVGQLYLVTIVAVVVSRLRPRAGTDRDGTS